MGTTTSVRALALLTVSILLSFPGVAQAEPQVVDRQVHQTTGAEVALDMLAGLQSVDVDTSGVTLRVEQAGEVRPVRVDLGGVLGVAEGPSTSGAVRFGAIAVALTMLVRVVRVLTRLGREES